MEEDEKPWNYDALIAEYQASEQDNSANFQGYWTLAAIFFGISSALLAGLIYGILSNENLFKALFHNNEQEKTVVVGIIAFLLAIANIFILKRLKGWHRRILFNQRINLGRMMEIELDLGMKRVLQARAIDEWQKKSKKTFAPCDEQKWKLINKSLMDNVHPSFHPKLEKEKYKLLEIISRLINNETLKYYYESPSSRKHYPHILYTLMSLWVLIVALASFLIGFAFHQFYCGLSIGLIIITIYGFCLFFGWKKKQKKEHKS